MHRAILVLTLLLAAPAVLAETRAVEFPATFRPNSLNNIAASRTAPVSFVGSRDTDTVFAFDPRTGLTLGAVEVSDGPLAVELFEGPETRLLGVTCDGFLGASANFVTLVDATDPANMRLLRTIEMPQNSIFFLGYQTLRFVNNGSAFVVTATDIDTAEALLLAYDVATGAEIGRVDVGFVPGSIDIVLSGGRTVAAISQSVAPRGRITIVDITDVTAMSVARTIRLPKRSGLYNVNNVVLGADGAYGYVAAGDANAFFTFEVATGRVLSRTVTGAFPSYVHRFTIDGAPRLLVTAQDASAVFVYDLSDPASPQLLTSYDSSAAFFDVDPAISSDGRTAFAASLADSKVYAVDLVNGRLVYQTATSERPVAAAVWEGGGERYVSVSGIAAASITTFRDAGAGYDVRTFAGPAGGVLFTLYQNVALSRDGRLAFAASKVTNELLAFDVATGTIAGRVGVCAKPSQIAVAEDANGRRRVAVLGSADSTLSVVDATDPSAMEAVGSVDLASPFPFFLEYANVAATADGTTVFVADGNQFVYAVDLASAEIVGSVSTGFTPISLALREDRGQRRLAVLNVMAGSSSVTVLDVTDRAAMARVASTALPEDLVVALNNVPRFTPDGQFVIVGASLSERAFVIDATSGRVAGSVSKTSAVVPAPYLDGGVQKFAAVNLGTDPAALYQLKPSGKPRAAGSLGDLDGSFILVGNDPTILPGGEAGFVPNYGRASLVTFDPRTAAVTGELPLGKGPGQTAFDPVTGTVVALEVNGTSSRVLFADVADSRLGGVSGARTRSRYPSRVAPGATGAVEAARARDGVRRFPRVATYSTESKSIVEWNPRSSQK